MRDGLEKLDEKIQNNYYCNCCFCINGDNACLLIESACSKKWANSVVNL